MDIKESQRIRFIRAPPIRSGNQVGDLGSGFDPNAEVHLIDSMSALVHFRPRLAQQIQLAQKLGTDDSEGLAGQFIVEYDVERPSEGGTVRTINELFVITWISTTAGFFRFCCKTVSLSTFSRQPTYHHFLSMSCSCWIQVEAWWERKFGSWRRPWTAS